LIRLLFLINALMA